MSAKDLIQKATEYDKQSARYKKVRPFDTLHQTHWLQPKYDGCHLIIDTSARRAFSRTNETVRSCDHLVARCLSLFGPGWTIQGEAYMQEESFPFISGKYRQHADWEAMEFVAYDMLPSPNFAAGRWDTLYRERFSLLEQALDLQPRAAGHVYITESMPALGMDVLAYANRMVAEGGYDGAVLRDPNMPWVAGKATWGELVKVKPTVSLDLMCTGYSYKPGEKTGRDVLTLTVAYRGVETEVGSGIPHSLHWTDAFAKIVEIECMAVNPNNTLREPRFKSVRFDKKEADK